MQILFMGTAELACPCLHAVAQLPEHQIVGVITQPDRPKGRDLKPSPPPLKVIAEKLGLPVHQPVKVREATAIEQVRSVQPDLIIVVAYGQLLPKVLLEIPPLGCINVHASLLPRWRGASPIQHAILEGDRETGVTTMYLNERMDAGDIILQRTEPIRDDDTAATLHDRLAMLGAELLVETVALLAANRAPRRQQKESAATHARQTDQRRRSHRLDETGRSDRAPDPRFRPVARSLHVPWRPVAQGLEGRSDSTAAGCARPSRG